MEIGRDYGRYKNFQIERDFRDIVESKECPIINNRVSISIEIGDANYLYDNKEDRDKDFELLTREIEEETIKNG